MNGLRMCIDPTSSMDVNEFQPLRGNVYTNYKRDADGK